MEQYDTVRRRKNGTLVDVSLTLSPIKNNEGKIIGASAIAHDIANRKRADELIRASEERLTTIIQNAAESIYTMSLEGVFTFVSPAWTQKLGHDISEVEGKTFVPFIHPEDMRNVRLLSRGSPRGSHSVARTVFVIKTEAGGGTAHWLLNQGQSGPPG